MCEAQLQSDNAKRAEMLGGAGDVLAVRPKAGTALLFYSRTRFARARTTLETHLSASFATHSYLRSGGGLGEPHLRPTESVKFLLVSNAQAPVRCGAVPIAM